MIANTRIASAASGRRYRGFILCFAWLPVAASLAACQALAPEPRLDSPLFPVPAGTTLTLHEPLRIPANEVSVFVQNGRLRQFAEVDRYYPYCKFELWRMADVSRTVAPDEFRVRRVQRDWYLVGGPPGVRLAASVGAGVGGDAGGPLFQVRSTEMYLRSTQQPDVYRMTCAHWDDVSESRHLTIEQIRNTLAGVFSLKLPPEVRQALP